MKKILKVKSTDFPFDIKCSKARRIKISLFIIEGSHLKKIVVNKINTQNNLAILEKCSVKILITEIRDFAKHFNRNTCKIQEIYNNHFILLVNPNWLNKLNCISC